MLYIVKQDLSWYLVNGAVSSEAATNLDAAEFDQAVKDFVPHMNTVLASLGIPDDANR